MGRSDQPEGASAEDGGRSEPQMVMSPMNPTRARAETIVDECSTATKKVPPPLEDKSRHKSLREYRMEYRWNPDNGFVKLSTAHRLCRWIKDNLTIAKIKIPFLTYHVNYVNTNFGSGVGQYFFQRTILPAAAHLLSQTVPDTTVFRTASKLKLLTGSSKCSSTSSILSSHMLL